MELKDEATLWRNLYIKRSTIQGCILMFLEPVASCQLPVAIFNFKNSGPFNILTKQINN